MKTKTSIFTYEAAKDLDLTMPVFYAVFFPKFKHMFNQYYRCLPINLEIPKWSTDLFIYTGTGRNKGYNCDFKSHKIPWDIYTAILYRWKIFNPRLKKVILDANNRILEVFPSVNKYTVPESRKRLLPYVGMTLKLYADIKEISTFTGSKNEQKYSLVLVKIREEEESNEFNILAHHYILSLNSPRIINMFNLYPEDVLYFSTKIEKYINGTNRIALTNIYVLGVKHKVE